MKTCEYKLDGYRCARPAGHIGQHVLEVIPTQSPAPGGSPSPNMVHSESPSLGQNSRSQTYGTQIPTIPKGGIGVTGGHKWDNGDTDAIVYSIGVESPPAGYPMLKGDPESEFEGDAGQQRFDQLPAEPPTSAP